MSFLSYVNNTISLARRSNRDASTPSNSNIQSWRKEGLHHFSSPGRCDRGSVASDWVGSRMLEKWPMVKVCVADFMTAGVRGVHVVTAVRR